jgi:hypothetical protein
VGFATAGDWVCIARQCAKWVRATEVSRNPSDTIVLTEEVRSGAGAPRLAFAVVWTQFFLTYGRVDGADPESRRFTIG